MLCAYSSAHAIAGVSSRYPGSAELGEACAMSWGEEVVAQWARDLPVPI